MLRLARPKILRNLQITACLKEGLVENPSHTKSQDSQSKKLLTLAKKPELFNGNQIVETDEIEQLYRGIDVLLLAHSPNVIDAFAEFIKLAAEEFEVDFGGFSDPLVHQDKWRVNKANTNFGKHKMEYAARSYKKVVHLLHLTESTREILLYYIESNVPPGVGIEVRSFKLVPFPEKFKAQIERDENYLEEHDKAAYEQNEKFKATDNLASRKYKNEVYEHQRRPWNATIEDLRRPEVHKRRTTWRRETTLNNL